MANGDSDVFNLQAPTRKFDDAALCHFPNGFDGLNAFLNNYGPECFRQFIQVVYP